MSKFRQVDSLPGTKDKLAFGDGDRDGAADEGGLEVRYRVTEESEQPRCDSS